MITKDEVFNRLGFDHEDKVTLANWCLCFGGTGILLLMLVGTEWYLTILNMIFSTIVVLSNHYYKKYYKNRVIGDLP